MALEPSYGLSSSSAIVGSGPMGTATKAIVADTVVATVATVTSTTTVFGDDTALTSPKRGDAPEELVPTHGAFFFALGCGSALIVTLVAVTSALAYKRTNKSLLRSKSKTSLQWVNEYFYSNFLFKDDISSMHLTWYIRFRTTVKISFMTNFFFLKNDPQIWLPSMEKLFWENHVSLSASRGRLNINIAAFS